MKTNFKSLANEAWKVENFSMFGVIRYIQKSKEVNLLSYLKDIKVKPSEITIDFIKSGAKPERFFCHTKSGEVTGEKVRFSLWFILTSLKAAKVAENLAGINEHEAAKVATAKAAKITTGKAAKIAA